MLTELHRQLRQFTRPGDSLYCAVSGGADSMALLWGAYLLRDQLGIVLSAVHFNHHLRGAESDRDEQFVRNFCQRFEIPLVVGGARIAAGKKGLEAAAREARYAFFDTLPGLIATAHTADDNAETVLMHLIRGTGLKGLGGIAPVCGSRIRPMLGVTRQQVTAFLEEYHIAHVEDSSNAGDAFLRNRLRHSVMPLLKAENPRLAENISAMALSLRWDEQALAQQAEYETLPGVTLLKSLPPAVRSRMLERFLKENGVSEPEREHIVLAESLIFSHKPSAVGHFPGGVTLRRNYERLEAQPEEKSLETVVLPECGTVELLEAGLLVSVQPAKEIINHETVFTVNSQGPITIRARQSGDTLRLAGGTKQLKKLFIDRKIPAARRLQIPVVSDAQGVLGVYGIGVNLERTAPALPAVQICFVKKENKQEETL